MESLKLVKKSRKAEHLIIFVHGFTGGSKTFVRNNSHMCNLFNKSILDVSDIYEFNYYSRLIDFGFIVKTLGKVGLFSSYLGDKFNVNLIKYSELLQTHYNNHSSKYKSINIIGHSMGGLIAKHCVIEIIKKYGAYQGFYISLATPHRGLSEAKLGALFGNIQISDMEPFSAFIEETNTCWLKYAASVKRKYYCATHDTVVNDKSACPADDVKYLVRVEGTHTTMVKPQSANSALVKNLNQFIDICINKQSGLLVCKRELSTDDVLFNSYKIANEPYYLIRFVDNRLKQLIDNNNVWISGPTGAGKTNLIQHYLAHSNSNYYCIDMSPNPPTASANDMMLSIYWALRDKINTAACDTKDVNDSTSIISKISDLVMCIGDNNDVILYIDELHVDDDECFGQFVDNITTLISYNSNIPNKRNNLKIIISSISDPTVCNTRFKPKYHALFNHYPITYWNNADLISLLNIIDENLRLNIRPEDIINMISIADGSPRRLKNMVRKLLHLKSIKKAMKEVQAEGIY